MRRLEWRGDGVGSIEWRIRDRQSQRGFVPGSSLRSSLTSRPPAGMSRGSNVLGATLTLTLGTACAVLLGEAVARAYFLTASGGVGSSAAIVQDGQLFEYDEVLGYHMIPGAHIRFAGPEFDVRFSINRAGFRQKPEVSPERTPGRRRILLLGDSFVFGQGVIDSDRFGDRLATVLPDTEVVNMGMSGTG